MKKAFTLVEMTVALGLFALLMVVVMSLFLTTLRGARKAAAVGLAKAEGAYALDTMAREIRFAKEITSASCGNSVTMIGHDDLQLTYSFVANQKIASAGAHLATGDNWSYDLTSARVDVSPGICPQIFTCSADGRTVTICFGIENATGIDVTDQAGNLQFKTQVTLRNIGN